MTKKINSTACPFCHQHNQCAVENKHGCWCYQIEIPTELIKLIPNKLVNQSCICNVCIQAFIHDREDFLNKL